MTNTPDTITDGPALLEIATVIDFPQPATSEASKAPPQLGAHAPNNAAIGAHRGHGIRNLSVGGALIVALLAATYYGHDYWTVGRFQISTDDAYVKADSSSIAPKVSGYLSKVLVADNERVKLGQPLAQIDDRDFSNALDQAKADVSAAEATVNSKQAAVEIQQSTIEAARATLDVDRANETFAEQNDKRYASLSTNGYAPVQTAQQAAAQIASAQATIARDTASLSGGVKQIDLLKAELAQSVAALLHSNSVQRQAELNLSYTTVIAPVDGVVGNRTLRIGQFVQAGTQLMSVVPTDAVFIIANYKETQLTFVRIGQKANIGVDMFPGRVFHGKVDSLAPASGQEFALLPPDNATGNFTKVVQRIPVKIVLDAESVGAGDLVPGMSVEPEIDTKDEASRQSSGL